MRYVMGRYGVSTRRACRVVQATRSSVYYTSRKEPLTALRQRRRELAQTRVRFGYRRLRVLLLREGGRDRRVRFPSAVRMLRIGADVILTLPAKPILLHPNRDRPRHPEGVPEPRVAPL